MGRQNKKKQLISYENAIKKSNDFSMAKLSHKLTLNQMQLLAYAIYSTQKDGKTEFIKADFEKKFNLGEYRREEAKNDSRKLFDLEFSLDDLERDEFDYLHVFQRINYKNGLFTFKWSEDMIPHIHDLQELYIVNGFMTISSFKSSFSWILYDYLKGHYGYWHKPISKEALMQLFNVHDKKTYQNHTGRFKKTVLDVAIEEINKYTELEVRYKEEKEGRAIVGFDIHWSAGEKIEIATKRQIKELQSIIETVFDDMYEYVNINDVNDRQRAIKLTREVEEMRVLIAEPICITKEKADESIKKAGRNFRELNRLFEENKKLISLGLEKKVKFYNWLEDRS